MGEREKGHILAPHPAETHAMGKKFAMASRTPYALPSPQ